jgi:hypothetical protein
MLLLALLSLPLLSLCKDKNKMVDKIHSKMRDYLLWNGTLKFIIAQFSPIIICCGINLYKLDFQKMDGTGVSSVISIVFIILSAISLIVIFLIIRKYSALKQMNSEEFLSKFGALTEGLRVKGWVCQIWNILIMVRWVITCVVLITLRDYNDMQIIVLYIISVIFQLFIISGKPYDSSLENIISFINEVFVSFYLYILMLLTDFMGENNFRDQYG